MMQWWNTDAFLKAKDSVKGDFHDAEDSTQDIQRDFMTLSYEGNTREWIFQCRADISAGETLCITGNVRSLGLWNPEHLCAMSKHSNEENLWYLKVQLPIDQEVEYRYLVSVIIEPEVSKLPKKAFVVRRWESFPPRKIVTHEEKPKEQDTFAYFDGKEYNLTRGWLTSECIIQLKLFNKPIQLFKKKLQDRKIYVKVTPVNLAKSREAHPHSVLDDTLSLETFEQNDELWPITEIAVLNESERHFQFQEQFGHVYNEGDYIIFQVQVFAPETIAYIMDFYTYASQSEPSDPPYHIGFTCILPTVMKGSEGQLVVPITSVKHHPIGQVTVEYLIVKPIAEYNCTMQASMQSNWKDSWTGLEIGHRGVGSSFLPEHHKCADVRENTIASLKTAASHGADFVEFDVQLSRDLVPVLYHDFYVCISMRKKKDGDETEMLQLPLKDLSLDQLHLLKLYHVQEGRNRNSKFLDEHLEEHQPFPTLKQALEVLDPSVGFNVEIKWTMKRKDGSYELSHPFDLNLFLDVVLKVVLQNAGSRPIVFSCFHPDICTMIQYKQNKYPVMFLTQCTTPKYPDYYDPRCQSVPMAVHFAVCHHILGINVHTEELLRDPSQVKLTREANLVIFCWGEDNNDTDTIKYLKGLGLHGVIYDKIDKLSCKEAKESIFRLEARESEKALIKAAAEKAERESTAVPSEKEKATESDLKNYILNMDKVHAASARVTGSTASGFSIWSVDQFGKAESEPSINIRLQQNRDTEAINKSQ